MDPEVPSDEDFDEAVEAAEGLVTRVARLADGSGDLVLDGPGAGSVRTPSAGDESVEVSPIRDRESALDGRAPLFLVHRPYRYWRSMPRLLANIHASAGIGVALGVVSRLGMFSEDSHREFHGLCGAASVRIVDPEGSRSNPRGLRFLDTSPRQLARAPYLAPGAVVNVADVLDLQRERGANLLLTPGRALDPANPQPSLDEAFADGDEALAHLRSGERVALNLCMSADWLTSEHLRDALLAQLLDQEQFDTWYLRVQWSTSIRSHAQPILEPLLRGYRRIAELAADEGHILLLPQTGLTGWLMLAFGASGFGSGIGGAEQAFREETGGGGNGAPPIERYFERSLLHTIERTSRHIVLGDPAYVQCHCPYCAALLAGPAWSHEYAGLHQVFNAGLLTSAVAPTGRGGTHGAVRRTVQAARHFALGKALTGLSEPRHLQVWDRVL